MVWLGTGSDRMEEFGFVKLAWSSGEGQRGLVSRGLEKRILCQADDGCRNMFVQM